MLKVKCRAVYNSRVPNMQISPLPPLRAPALPMLLLLLSAAAVASNWSAPEEQLAAKIAAVTGPGAVFLQFENRSSVNRAEFEDIRRSLTTELSALGLRPVAAEQAAATVQVSFSENLQNYVWVAQIHVGNNEPVVVMVSLPRGSAGSGARPAAPIVIRKALLWTQPDRILDVAVMDASPTHMAVLDPARITLYKLQDAHWLPEQSLAITHQRPWPRDMRGRLVLRKDHLLDAYLPGVVCRTTTTSPLGLNCYGSDDPWPLGAEPLILSAFFAPARNFFTGALAPGIGKQTTTAPFYSAAMLPREKYALWITAATDGQVHLLDGIADRAMGTFHWGGDIASVHSGCGGGWQVLATADSNGADSIRAFEIPDREPVAVSQPAEFADAVTALWTESVGSSAIAVSRNPETGNYEAYRVSLACGQ